MLDIYVDRRSNFERMGGYKLQYMLRGMGRAGLAWRILDRCNVDDIGGSAFLHVDLTDVPASFREVARRYPRCVNVDATTIRRTQYSRARLMPEDGYDGPVIAKTILNSRGFPELRYEARAGVGERLAHLARKAFVRGYKQQSCPAYRVYPSLPDVPAEIWIDERMMVERFLPGHLDLPVVKHRLDFFFEVEINTRAVFNSLLCDPETIDRVDVVPDVPDEIRRIRRELKLDYGAIDYFMVDDDAFAIDANKTVTMTDSWIARFPSIARHAEEVTERLVAFVREG